MTQPSDVESCLAALEARMEVVAADAEAARHLAAARDRDLADLGVKVDANRIVIYAFGQQLNSRIDGLDTGVGALEQPVDEGFARMDQGFTAVRGQLDATAAGQQTIVDMLTRLINGSPEPG